jgi:alkylation response protein AidB-like acyl-CoA dehydrogenase
MGAELGLLGIALPEERGGQGAGFLELGLVLEQMGRELAGGPYLASSAVAAPLLAELPLSDAQRDWLPQIAAGELIATLGTGSALECRTRDGMLRASGELRFVLAADSADLILMPAQKSQLVACRRDAPGVQIEPLTTLDPTRRQAHVTLRDAPVELVAEQAAAPLARALDRARIALGAEMVGGAARCLERAVEHARERMQFGRPIGSFQAVKHKAADVLLELESARSIAYWSWWVADQPTSSEAELAEAASLAKSVCGDAYLRAAAEAIQILGGTGFTWESDAHLYYRRAQSSLTLFGDTASHRARLADQLLA